MKTSFKCPPSQRRCIDFDLAKHKDKTVVITEENVHEWRSGYLKPHRYWDWLLDNSNGIYQLSYTGVFAYMMEECRCGYRSIVIFDSHLDAFKFYCAHGGQVLRDFADDFCHEWTVDRLIRCVTQMTREARRRDFPGLDDLIVGSAEKIGHPVGLGMPA